MGAPAEVVAGVAEVLAARGLDATPGRAGDRHVFRVGDVVVTVGPLPAERATHAIFHPRALLVVEGTGATADAVKAAIRLKFLRVTG